VLLEVVLALVLFVAAAALVTGGMNASLRSVERLRLSAHAADLAVTVLSELQMGLRSLDDPGPDFFDVPFDDWIWELVADSSAQDSTASARLVQVEVVITHEDPPLVYRLSQMMRIEQSGSAGALDAGAPLF
jgi:hypothetical protein